LSHTPQPPPLAKIEQKNIVDLIKTGKRVDGRQLEDHRELKIEVGLISKANGSAQVILGKTKVLVGVKIETGAPFPDTPNEGVLTVNAELVPLASPDFETGPPNESSIELARVVDRGVRESKSIDTSKLCIKAGEKVFVVFIDIYVLDHDGNLIDASAIAALTALLNAKMNSYEVKDDGELVLKPELVSLPIQNLPVPVTVAKIGDVLAVDPCLEEEHAMSARLTVAFDKNGNICAMQKGGQGELSREEVGKAVSIISQKSSSIREKILEASQ